MSQIPDETAISASRSFTELVNRAQAGDEYAIKGLSVFFSIVIEAHIRSLVKEEEVIPELTYEALMKAWKQLPHINDSQIHSLLHLTATSVARHYLRRYDRSHTAKRFKLQDMKGIPVLRISINEEPLTARSLSTVIAAITDLHTRCWFIQQKRFTDLMDYAQTRDSQFIKETSLHVGTMTHNSPAVIDFLINSGGSLAGAATLVFALKKGIDAIAQTPLRFQATKLKNEREVLEQKIREEEAQQEQKIAAQKAQLDVERQQLELERQRLEFEKNRVKIALEIAATVVNNLQPDIEAGQKEMVIHTLVPSLLQLAMTEGLEVLLPAPQAKEENQESSEDK